MKPNMLNAILQIQLNGCSGDQIDIIPYTLQYVQEHGRCEVWKRGNKRQFEEEEENIDFMEVEEEVEDPKTKVLIGKSVLF